MTKPLLLHMVTIANFIALYGKQKDIVRQVNKFKIEYKIYLNQLEIDDFVEWTIEGVRTRVDQPTFISNSLLL